VGGGNDAGAALSKSVELRRHTDNDGDCLTDDGVRAALEIGAGLVGGYTLVVSSGMQRATQTAACFLGALGQRVPGGVIVEPGLRTQSEGRWREIYAETRKPDLASFRAADPEFVDAEVASLGAALRRVFDRLEDGGRALAVGHSPTNEAAAFALTGETVRPLAKGEGVLVVEEAGAYRAEELG
jgi:broad specificity phosphatase PhoE